MGEVDLHGHSAQLKAAPRGLTRVAIVAMVVVACGGSHEASVPSPNPQPSASPTVETAPAARGYSNMAFGGDGAVYLFGGFTGIPPTGQWQDDLWTYRNKTGWVRLAADGTLPPPGDGFSVDSRSAPLFLDGTGKVWRFASTSHAWGSTTQAGPALHGIHMVYDNRSDRFVVFGGDDFTTIFDRTWKYDPKADKWTQMKPKISPPGRTFYASTYDSKRDLVILFGGYTDGGQLADTWSYNVDTDTWTQLKPRTSPPARDYSAMVYDSVRDRLLLFGGADAGETAFGDMWTYDFRKNTWTEITPTGERPSPRAWHAMAFDGRSGLAVLFGGGPAREKYNAEVWLFDTRSDSWSLG